MNTNPILEEVRRIKEQLAAEAGHDVDRFVDQLRAWTAAHPHTSPVMRNAEELRQLIAAKERHRAENEAMALNDKPPRQN